jgi:hypothetical protein
MVNSAAVRQTKTVSKTSAANRGHRASGFVAIAEFVVLGLVCDGFAEELNGIRAFAAERLQQVDLAVTAEARTQLAVGGEAELVAAFTKVRVRESADKTEPCGLAQTWYLAVVIFRGAVAGTKVRERGQAAFVFDPAHHFHHGKKI